MENNTKQNETKYPGLVPVVTSKKSKSKWAQREKVANIKAHANPSEWLAAKNRENALKNLPSSMR